jgi:ubiquinone biosynthesis protein UbiJ
VAIDPTIHTAGLAGLESALNHALNLAPEGKAELASLEDSVFALHCTSPALDVYLQTGADGVRLMGVYDGPVTTRVRGAASDFTELASSQDPTATLINGKLELEGNSAALIELQRILGRLDIDWEAPLVDRLGDIAGHQLAQLLRATFSWGKQASSSLRRQLEEFIHEEARLCPPRLELEDFYADVQQLGLKVERLTLRIQRLRKKLPQQKG